MLAWQELAPPDLGCLAASLEALHPHGNDSRLLLAMRGAAVAALTQRHRAAHGLPAELVQPTLQVIHVSGPVCIMCPGQEASTAPIFVKTSVWECLDANMGSAL